MISLAIENKNAKDMKYKIGQEINTPYGRGIVECYTLTTEPGLFCYYVSGLQLGHYDKPLFYEKELIPYNPGV